MLDGGAADLVLNYQLAGVIQLSTCSNEVLGLKAEADSRTQLIRLATVGDKADFGGADVFAGVTGDVDAKKLAVDVIPPSKGVNGSKEHLECTVI